MRQVEPPSTVPPETRPPVQEPPFVLPETVELREGIVFARPPGKTLALDLFLPRRRPAAPRPGIVYVHGGGWRGGHRQAFWRQAAHLADLGLPGITITYRFAPEHRYPAQLEDVRAGVAWLRANAAELGVDATRLGAAGGSAGGHLAALLGTTETIADGCSTKVQAVVAFNGVFDFLTLDTIGAAGPRRDLLGGDPQLEREASPLHRADARAAPALLLHGTADQTVPFAQSVAFQRCLAELGVRAELYAAEGAGHGFFNRPPHFRPTLERMTQFFLDVLGEAGRRE
ncbi:MAG TPA: alpha/beta hydrolase [Chloroflexota bacterium]|nr:alpha/beta hydrolase [Chloroflexota bacterium]